MGYTGDVLFDKVGGEAGTQIFVLPVNHEAVIRHPKFSKGAGTLGKKSTEALRGFRLIYPKLGELSKGDKWNEVKYHHKKSGVQVIEYIDRFNFSKSYLVMQTITVHDHGSIPTGGPAFATYFSESEEEEN